MYRLLQNRRGRGINTITWIEKLELFKSTKNIDYTVVEILDKFSEKYLTEPKPTHEYESPQKKMKTEIQKLMN